MARVTKKQVAEYLHPSVWKSPLEIVEAISSDRSLSLEQQPVAATIVGHLNDLVDEQVAKKRPRQLSDERLRARGGNGEDEYCLTEEGLRARATHASGETGLHGSAIPQGT